MADTSISAIRIARELTALIEKRGKPKMIVSDHGTELTSAGCVLPERKTALPVTDARGNYALA
jgi:hypothetical protein